MKYGELIQFEPIESVIQLRSSDEAEEARRLVDTYVISDRMAELLTGTVLPQLQFESPQDNKGLLVVGKYGTGKSHLMAVVSAIAERGELAGYLAHPAVARTASMIAGRFRVLRVEIGAVEMSLRDILCNRLEHGLAAFGVDFRFQAADRITDNKSEFVRMMEAFHHAHPDHGLLLVVDEILDYLRGRKDVELVRDFGFLREVGEVCRDLRFRFLGGLQEALFDNPTFQFASESLRRVQARFEQLRIVRDDVAFVVKERLLHKSPDQKAKVRRHLEKFTPLYASMRERLDEFVDLFPVHPAYLEVFEQVYVAEKREILKSLSRAMRGLLDRVVPGDEPGLLSYDHYWGELGPSYRAVEDVRKVMDRSQTVQDRVDQGFRTPATLQLKPVAVRILHALSVQRLVGGDIHTPVGVTVEQLRDGLALHVPGVPNAEFLKTTVETVLRDIVRTVSGQFISFNPENGQYYLDVEKDIDFDAIIEKRADQLSNHELDRFYFDALARVLDRPEATYVPGYQIWQHWLPWLDRNTERPGYLFFGAPTERSTAQPPRDYYLYFLQPFDPPSFKDARNPDEVFFTLEAQGDEFLTELKLYAAARLVAQTAGGHRSQYEEKATSRLRSLTKWLREHLLTAFRVTYQGSPKPLGQWLEGQKVSHDEVKEVVRTAGAVALGPHFHELAPRFPRFPIRITEENRAAMAEAAVRHLSAGVETQTSRQVLDALELLDGREVRPLDHRDPTRGSRYARHLWGVLSSKGEGQVVNRSELMVSPYKDVEYDREFRLEPEWVVVLLVSLIRCENVTLALPGRKLDASNLKEAARLPISELASFRNVQRPRHFDAGVLRELFRLLELPEALALEVEQGSDAAVQQLQSAVSDRLERIVVLRRGLAEGFEFWGQSLLDAAERSRAEQALERLQKLFDSLQVYTSPARLKGFQHKAADIASHSADMQGVRDLESLKRLLDEVGPPGGYLMAADALLPSDHPWRESLRTERDALLGDLQHPEMRVGPKLRSRLRETLERLKEEYVAAYMELHRRHRLDAKEESRRARVLASRELGRLRRLASLAHLPSAQLEDLENRLSRLKPCSSLTGDRLARQCVCPECNYRPGEEPEASPAGARLERLEEELARLHEEWTRTLVSELGDPMVRQNLELLTPSARRRVEDFVASGELPVSIDNDFLEAAGDALSGLERVSLNMSDVTQALVDGGLPCTPDELQARFSRLVEGRTRGKDSARVRVVLDV